MDVAVQELLDINLNELYSTYKATCKMILRRVYTNTTPIFTKLEYIGYYTGLVAELKDPDNQVNIFDTIDELSLIDKSASDDIAADIISKFSPFAIFLNNEVDLS